MKAITNAKIYTMTGRVIDCGTVFWDKDIITKISDKPIPLNTDVIDAKGGILTPGLINSHSNVGLKESSLSYVAGDDSFEKSFPITPHLEPMYGVNPEDIEFNRMIKKGITTVAVATSNNSVFSGGIQIFRTYGLTIEDKLIKRKVGIKASLGMLSKRGSFTKTRMANVAMIRDVLYMTKGYLKAKLDPEAEKLPANNIIAESLIPVLNKEIPLFIYANRRDDIYTALRISKEFDIKVVILGGAECHLIADELALNNVKCIIVPALKKNNYFETMNININGPKILTSKNVNVSLVSDMNTLDASEITSVAIKLRQNGYNLEETLEYFTINAASILGIDNAYGSIEVGKKANLVLYSGEPFTIKEKIERVFIEGLEIITKGGELIDSN